VKGCERWALGPALDERLDRGDEASTLVKVPRRIARRVIEA